MQQICPECKLVIEINPINYAPGSVVRSNCPRCGHKMEFDIPPKEEENIEIIPPTPAPPPPPAPVQEMPEVKPGQPSPAPEYSSEPPVIPPPVIPPPPRTEDIRNQQPSSQPHKESDKKNILIGITAALIIIVAGLFYYFNVYVPAERDKNAPRYYPFATNVHLRSSPMSGIEANKITTVPYGGELIFYGNENGWSEVKYEGQEGFIATDYIMDKSNFFLLNSIFGDSESKECVATAKCRVALLNYFKENKYVGNISDQILAEILPGFVRDDNNQWQVFALHPKTKPNTVFYKRIYDSKSKFTDFAVLITNIQTKERKILIFSFDNDETPFLIFEGEAPANGYIKDITTYTPSYSTQRHVNVEYK